MDLRALRYFVAVAEHGTVTAAAVELHMTQPALSRAIRGLEREWGVSLFNRESGRLRLSSAGRELATHARDLLQRADRLAQVAHHHAGGALVSLTLAAPTTTLTDIVSPFVATLRRDDPLPEIWDAAKWTVAEALQHGADLVVSLTPGPPGTDSVRLPRLGVHAYVPAEHRWATRTAVDLDELHSERLIGLRQGTSARHALDLAIESAELPLLTMLQVGNGTIAQALCAAGRGVALLSDDPRFGLHQLSVLDAGGSPLGFTLHCSWSDSHPASTALSRIARRISEWISDNYPPVPR